MNAMHNFLCRLFFYVLAIMLLKTTFGSWPEFDSAASYFAHYGPLFITYVAIFEAGYQIAGRLALRGKENTRGTH